MTHEQYIETLQVTPGTVLPNGWTVVDIAVGDEHAVVLAVTHDFGSHPYATWFMRLSDDEHGTFWGEYYATLADAVRDFNDRAGR